MSMGSTTHARRHTGLRALAASALAVVAVSFGATPIAGAIERDRAGWYHTGDGVVAKSIVGLKIDVFAVGHDMKCLPSHKSRLEVVGANCDKRLVWRMMRDVDKATIAATLRKAYRTAGYADSGNVARAISAFDSDLGAGSVVTISYDARANRTTFSRQDGPSVSVSGSEFMRATWRILFVNEDLRSVGDALISKL
jgi:hypothetical protein